MTYHIPVLLQESLDYLRVQPGKKYIDATLGGGGHTFAILEKGGTVLGIDQDEEAIEHVKEKIKSQKATFKSNIDLFLVKENFKNLSTIAEKIGFTQVAGILMDIGISSHQIDTQERGFSFLREAPLDMRMNRSEGITAADLINALSEKELVTLFERYGEEQNAKSLVRAILRTRKIAPIRTTTELAEIIRRVYPKKHERIHPATKIFQALRIVVNDELHVLSDALPQAVSLLGPGGRLAVITFHSLEDRIVKHMFADFVSQGLGEIITKKPIYANDTEIQKNSRSRSAKLRVFQKTG